MSATPLDPRTDTGARLPGGMVLPPLPLGDEAETDRSRPAPTEPRVVRGFNPWPMFCLSILFGALAGGGSAWWIVNAARMDVEMSQERLTQIEGVQRDLDAQIGVMRGQQLELDRQVQETRQVVASITLEASKELKSAQQNAARAQQDLANLKVEAALNSLNLVFDQAGSPIVITEGRVAPNSVSLKITYWGFRITEHEALQFLQRFVPQLQQAFSQKSFPKDFVITFVSAQNARQSVYRNGLWDPKSDAPTIGGR